MADDSIRRWIKETNEETFERRFMTKVTKRENGCWEWMRFISPAGYGRFQIKRFTTQAHRVSYWWFVGPIPDGLPMDHLCRNRCCVNPEHLEPVSWKENALRGFGVGALNAQKTHCAKGHPFSEENTYLHGNMRFCRKCHYIRSEQYAERQRKQKRQA